MVAHAKSLQARVCSYESFRSFGRVRDYTTFTNSERVTLTNGFVFQMLTCSLHTSHFEINEICRLLLSTSSTKVLLVVVVVE
jgi:hypothetical protein